MKEIFNNCSQVRKYGPSRGQCLVQLEEGETLDDVKDKYILVERDWWEQRYSNAKELSSYTQKFYNGEEKVHTGRLVLMDTFREYLD